jgi:hypothetical protein
LSRQTYRHQCRLDRSRARRNETFLLLTARASSKDRLKMVCATKQTLRLCLIETPFRIVAQSLTDRDASKDRSELAAPFFFASPHFYEFVSAEKNDVTSAVSRFVVGFSLSLSLK